MSARRRRVGSESDQAPIIVTTDPYNSTTEQYDKHEGKLKRYPERSSKNNNENLRPPPPVDSLETMAARDRTMEFAKAIQSLQSRNITRAVSLRDPKKATYIKNHAEFMMIARTVGRNVASTYAKLEKLTLLARNISPFDGPNSIPELTYIIKEDLNSLNQQIAKLQEVARSQKQGDRSRRHHLLSHSSNVVLALQSKLASMSNEFKKVLELRTENLKLKKNRQDKFDTSGAASAALRDGRNKGSLLEKDDEVSIDFDSPQEMVPLFQNQAQLAYDQTDDYLQSRAETMQNIESTIVELGGIFMQLADMVKEQEEMVNRIDTNVDAAFDHVEAAHSQILKYFQTVTSNRRLMIKVFGVLMFFFVFFVVFMT